MSERGSLVQYENGYWRSEPGAKVDYIETLDGFEEYAACCESMTVEVLSSGAADLTFIVVRTLGGRERWYPLTAIKQLEFDK